MKPFTDYCSHYAIFFDNLGHYVGSKKLKWKDKSFAFKEGLYNFLPEKSSFFKVRTLFVTRKYYMYNLDDSMPIRLDGNNKGIIDPRAYKRILETDLIKKLNDIANQGIIAFLMQPKVLIPLLIIIGLVWYFASGHTPQDAIAYASGG